MAAGISRIRRYLRKIFPGRKQGRAKFPARILKLLERGDRTMKILHTADFHLGELAGPVISGENARMLDTINCIEFMIEKARDENPDVIVIAGDLFNKSKLWADEMLREIGVATDRLRELAKIAPTVLLFGTREHDNFEAFNNIRDKNIPRLRVVAHPQLLEVLTASGPLTVAAVPGYDKGYFRTNCPAMSPEEENEKCSELLGDIVLNLSEEASLFAGVPSVLVAHYAVSGTKYDSGQSIYQESEVVLLKETLQQTHFDLVCLGHLHRAQEVSDCGRPTFYSGSLNGITFNEEGQNKGFWMHDILIHTPNGARNFSNFINTPSREFYTLQLNEFEIEEIVSRGSARWLFERDPEGASWAPLPDEKIVRVHFTCSDELAKQFNRKALERDLYAAGAFYVKEIIPKNMAATLTKQEMNETADPLVNLKEWAQKEGYSEIETTELIEMAKPILATVSAKTPTGKLSGIFRPELLEVRSYRSFRTETFDFKSLKFATVNGPNGIGKSAFFMDAICDCLFEETREGDISGWISNGKDVKSGAITFVFSMGDTHWRVMRARSKAGKVTLALQEMVNEQWLDRAEGFNVRDTQQKIINLLGMDATTFRCCALIMQDAYGLFMEADKTERMEVLANILGLNVYELLCDVLKSPKNGIIPDLNRKMEKAKTRLAELNERLKHMPVLQGELGQIEIEIADKAAAIDVAGKELKDAEKIVQEVEIKKQRLADLNLQASDINKEIADKVREKQQKQERCRELSSFLDKEDEIIAGAQEYEETKKQASALDIKMPRFNELQEEKKKKEQVLKTLTDSLTELDFKIRETEKLLSQKDDIQVGVNDYENTLQRQKELDILQEQWTAIDTHLREIKETWEKADRAAAAEEKEIDTGLEGLKRKVTMLENSNCIDPEKAQCRFLADAQEAKQKIPELEACKEALKEQWNGVKVYQQIYMDLKEKQDKLNYDVSEHKEVKARVQQLFPVTQQAAQLAGKTELLETLQGQRAQADKQYSDIKAELITLISNIDSLEIELKDLPKFTAKLIELEHWVSEKEKLPVAKQEWKLLNDAVMELELYVEGKQDQVVGLKNQYNKIQSEIESNSGAEVNLKQLQGRVNVLQDEQNTLFSRVGGLKTKIDDLENDETERAQLATDLEPMAKKLVQYQTLARAFGFDGIPFNVVRAVVPELSAMANEILGQMTGGKMSLEMRTDKALKSTGREVNTLEVWINDYQRGNLPYRSRSGGQKVKAALSVAFSLADLKASRAGIQLGMMFVDEPPFLDEEGTDAYCDALALLYEKYHGLDMKVIGISHDPRMKARFPQQIEVVDEGEEGSKVRLLGVA